MQDNARVHNVFGGRQFLQTVCSSAPVAVAAQAGIELAAPTKLSAQTSMSPMQLCKNCSQVTSVSPQIR
jgi:hypothetical protein